MIGIDGVLGNGWVECLGTGGSIRLVHVQPLVMKCRVEPTGRYWGLMNSRTTAPSIGWVELEVVLFGGLGFSGGRRSNLIKDSTAQDIFLANFSD